MMWSTLTERTVHVTSYPDMTYPYCSCKAFITSIHMEVPSSRRSAHRPLSVLTSASLGFSPNTSTGEGHLTPFHSGYHSHTPLCVVAGGQHPRGRDAVRHLVRQLGPRPRLDRRLQGHFPRDHRRWQELGTEVRPPFLYHSATCTSRFSTSGSTLAACPILCVSMRVDWKSLV